jgi:Arc/MetJ family transcription regulator
LTGSREAASYACRERGLARRQPMRTTLEIDDAIMAEALQATGFKTRREAVEAGLRLLARRAKQAATDDLFGAIDWRGDLEAERLDDEAPTHGHPVRHGRP